jgi:hypothetical protein
MFKAIRKWWSRKRLGERRKTQREKENALIDQTVEQAIRQYEPALRRMARD